MSFGNQSCRGQNNYPVQNTGNITHTVNNDNRSRVGDSISIGNVGTINSVGGSNHRNTITRIAGEIPTPIGIYFGVWKK